MFRILKLVLIILIAGGIAFLYWFLPKYSFVQKNPSFCTNLTAHLYYCGNGTDVKKLFESQNK